MEENVISTEPAVDAPPPPKAPNPAYQVSSHRRSPALAAFLSLFPGFGHLYNGEIGKALAFFCAFATCVFVMAETDGGSIFFGLLIPFIIFYNMIEAYRSAERINLQSFSGVNASKRSTRSRIADWSAGLSAAIPAVWTSRPPTPSAVRHRSFKAAMCCVGSDC